ncbi:hypothetical protein ACFO4O_04370 [Glaciecola siphonariae]|uniref:Uncharacterized protein n=1 Tax=Glaciecola siphonariae TaxID=521012 RepID=A0ABV9LVC3_9ALTE
MPRLQSAAVLKAKRLGRRFDMIRIDLATPIYLTDNKFNYTYQSNEYLANGLLLDVDVGAMTAGVEANDWEVTLSGVLDSVYPNVLAAEYRNRWVYHYSAYFDEDATGINIVGVEDKKHGQIISITDEDDDESGEIVLTITGPLGNVDQANQVKTNNVSQERRWGPDRFFQFAHETDFTIPNNKNSSSFVGVRFGGTAVSSVPSVSE